MTKLECIRTSYQLSKREMMSIIGISSYESYNRLESTPGKIKAHQVARLADHFGDAKFFIKFMFGELD